MAGNWPGSRLALNSVSIVGGKQKGGQLTMRGLAAELDVNGFGDDPKNLTASERIGREQPEPGLEGALVRLDVTAIKLAPVAADVPPEKLAGRVASLGQGVHCCWSDHNLSGIELHFHCVSFHHDHAWT